MNDLDVETLRTGLLEAGYSTGDIIDGDAFLAESPERVVWCKLFPTVGELIGAWPKVQAEAVQRTESLSAEKAWELYLVLASELPPAVSEEADLELIRRDTSYARKVLIPGVEELTRRQLADYLAPLLPLNMGTPQAGPDALSQLSAQVAGEEDMVKVVAAFEKNRPLFGDL